MFPTEVLCFTGCSQLGNPQSLRIFPQNSIKNQQILTNDLRTKKVSDNLDKSLAFVIREGYHVTGVHDHLYGTGDIMTTDHIIIMVMDMTYQ